MLNLKRERIIEWKEENSINEIEGTLEEIRGNFEVLRLCRKLVDQASRIGILKYYGIKL